MGVSPFSQHKQATRQPLEVGGAEGSTAKSNRGNIGVSNKEIEWDSTTLSRILQMVATFPHRYPHFGEKRFLFSPEGSRTRLSVAW